MGSVIKHGILFILLALAISLKVSKQLDDSSCDQRAGICFGISQSGKAGSVLGTFPADIDEYVFFVAL